jgi:hypothetical protein
VERLSEPFMALIGDLTSSDSDGCIQGLIAMRLMLDLSPSYAASFILGLSPARDAKRTSISRLNCEILPRLISDTRA